MSVTKMFAVTVVTAMSFGCFADAGPLKATNTWKGSVGDAKLEKEKPANEVITNAKDFEKLVKAWKVAEKVPEVNFDKELVLIATSPGSSLSLSATVDDKGDLKPIGIGTADFGTGFRYVIISVPKAGVKTVNGKPLPK